MKYSDIKKEWLYQKYVVENLSSREIAKILCCSREPIRKAIKKFGFPMGTIRSKRLGKKLSEEAIINISNGHIGVTRDASNGNWKGNNVGYTALHIYVKRRFPKPAFCECCGAENKRLDLANVSQEYKRDLSDWEWLCRRCHMIKDGRLEKFRKIGRNKNVPNL